jgi:hypothetical protein
MAAECDAEQRWFWRLVKLEVERSRRTEHPFTVLCVRGLDESGVLELAGRVRPYLRGTDALFQDTDRLLILLSETSGDAARRAVQRLTLTSGGGINAADATEVSFPRDAITFGALVDRLLDSETSSRLSIAG